MDIRWGVSPAYHISRYTDNFSPEDVAASLKDLTSMGFSVFQLEVFHPKTLTDWTRRGINLVFQAAEKANIYPSQFVGHFLLHGFGSAEATQSDFGIPEMKECLELLKPFPDCEIITVPTPALTLTSPMKAADYSNLWNRFVEKMQTMVTIAEDGGKRIALEIIPGSIVGGMKGFLQLTNEIKGNLGYNFDTGHAWAGREIIDLIPAMLGNKIFGTHLKDNNQAVNLALSPGKGTIPWDFVIPNLIESGYKGTWDIEIKCEPDEVRTEYEYGLQFLQLKIKNYQGV